MQDTYSVVSVTKTINAAGAVGQTIVQMRNITNTFGPDALQVILDTDFTVKPGDTHTLSLA